MNNINNKYIWVVVALFGALFLVGVGSKVFTDRIVAAVVDKLKKEYSPSPYGPGIDPDKIDMSKISKH
jgi:hypothetical protein